MKLKLYRLRETNNATIGMLFIDGVYFCDTLEDKIREKKIMHETCIDAGTYEVVINYSTRFKRQMPLLINVPKFIGIRIHLGNTIANTSGCILLGRNDFDDKIVLSKETFNDFYKKLYNDLLKRKTTIEIINNILK